MDRPKRVDQWLIVRTKLRRKGHRVLRHYRNCCTGNGASELVARPEFHLKTQPIRVERIARMSQAVNKTIMASRRIDYTFEATLLSFMRTFLSRRTAKDLRSNKKRDRHKMIGGSFPAQIGCFKRKMLP